MCNEQRNRIAAGMIRDDFQQLRIPLEFPEGVPNLEPRDSIRITDNNAIVRAGAGGAAELVVRRWSWPGANKRPVYNFRSEGRDLKAGRCLIVSDGFYEFTAPEGGAKRKTKWLFTKADEPWFMIAGLWRQHPEVGEAYTMLTCEPGADIAPYHSRQVVVLGRADWASWLDPAVPSAELTQPSPARTFIVERATAA
jgi:putative SOS response-associated peptidase YedK